MMDLFDLLPPDDRPAGLAAARIATRRGAPAVTTPAGIIGRYSPHRRCDSRCEFAIGPQCDCQCAGRNHGAGLRAALTELA